MTILKYDALSILITCPKCEHEKNISVRDFVDAVNNFVFLECKNCGSKYTISLSRNLRFEEVV